MSWKGAETHADKRPFLQARAKILSAIRAWFASEGFIEADVGAIVPTPGAETHIEAFAVDGGYLHTSPEFAMKQLLAAGETKIYRLGAAYRQGERGPLHAPEFTLLEWYRAHEPYERAMDDCLAITRAAAKAIDTQHLKWRGKGADAFAQAQHVKVRDVFPSPLWGGGRSDGTDNVPTHDDSTDSSGMLPTPASHGEADPPHQGEGNSDAFSAYLVEHVEPHLGVGAPTFLYEYPLTEAALARPCPHDPRVAERFELYACGVELANGYGELTDAEEQRRRFNAAMDEKQKRYGQRWPAPEAFLQALPHMPPASGCALGVDRLVMLLTGARRIDDVLWNPAP